MRSYWLGRQSESERSAFENLWFETDEDTELLSAVRDELIEDYLSNDLTSEESSQFKTFFLGELGMSHEVGLAAAIRDAAPPHAINNFEANIVEGRVASFLATLRRSLLLRPSLAAAGAFSIVLALGGFWIWQSLSGEIDRAAVELPHDGSIPLVNEYDGNKPTVPQEPILLPNTTPRPSPNPTPKPPNQQTTALRPVTLVLGAAVRGQGTISEVSIPENAGALRIIFPMPGLLQAYEKYDVRIVSAENGGIAHQAALRNLQTKKVGEDVVVTLKSPKLKVGDYKLILVGGYASKTDTILERGFRIKP